MNRVAIIYKRGRPDAAILAGQLDSWLREQGIQTLCQENVDDPDTPVPDIHALLPLGVDAVVVLGGDGTFLSVARLLAECSTPIVGVNLGAFGFMTEISRETCFRDLREIILGHYEIEERLRLDVTVLRDGKETFRQSVLNDAVINKGVLARILDLEASIDGRYLTHYRADGLIVATPTGSTAYNLSAGGPIVYPTAPVIILAPICSFTLTNRPIIIPSSSRVEIKRSPRSEDVVLTCDGQVGCSLYSNDQIIISASPNPLRLLKPLTTDYFEILRSKLRWGGNLRSPHE